MHDTIAVVAGSARGVGRAIASISAAMAPENLKEVILKRIPLGCAGKPEHVARAVRFLVVDGAYITGQAINVNGGIYGIYMLPVIPGALARRQSW